MIPTATFDAQGRLKMAGLLSQQEPLSHFAAYRDTTRAVPSNTWTDMQYDNVRYDTLGEYDTGTYRFTAKYAGYYKVKASAIIGPSTAWNS